MHIALEVQHQCKSCSDLAATITVNISAGKQELEWSGKLNRDLLLETH
jgi:hypothetical protein